MKGVSLEHGRRQVRPMRSRFQPSSARGPASRYGDHGQSSGGRERDAERGGCLGIPPVCSREQALLSEGSDHKPHQRELHSRLDRMVGNREAEIFELVLLSHDVATAAANADLAFTRLQGNVIALNRMTAAC
jgi:hypothetical protein